MLTPAPVQSTYTRYQPVGQPGMLADETNYVADSRIVETTAGVGFGLAVSQGTVSAKGCILGGSAFVGVTRADQTLPRSETLTVDKYALHDTAGVLVAGDIWVQVGGAVHVTDAVVYDSTTGVFGHSGGTTVHMARWMTEAVAGGMAVLRVWNASAPQT